MKKLVSALVVLMMLALACTAFAEADLSDWVEVQLPDIGMHFYRPADMDVGEPDTESAQAYVATNDDLVVAIYVIATNDSTADDIIASLQEIGMTAEVNALSEAGLTYDHIVASYEDVDTYGAVIFLGSDGYWYDFEVQALSDTGLTTFGMMLATLSPIE